MPTHRRRFLRLCGVAGIGAIAGCSSGSQDNVTPTGEQVATESATPLQSPAATLTPTGTPRSTQSTQQAKFAAEDGDDTDYFGISAALSDDGSTALIGARQDEDPNGEYAGSAYIFDSAGGSWSQQAKLAADDGESGDTFGSSVALSSDGTTAIICSSESVYVFGGSDESWSQQAKLTADDGESGDDFGSSVAVSSDGTTTIIGANSDGDPNGEDAGSAYVFESSDGSWGQQAKLAADDGDDTDYFGESIAVSSDGTTTLIGAFTDEDPNGKNAGSVYVFDNSGGSWDQQDKLVADDGDSEDNFGKSIAMSSDGSIALIGASTGDVAGSVYVFESSDGSWRQQAKFAPDDVNDFDNFGRALAAASGGSTALIGANGDNPNGSRSGSAYVFETSGESWNQQAKLAPDDGDDEDRFGSSAAVSRDGTTALVGASHDEDPNGDYAGSAYIFNL